MDQRWLDKQKSHSHSRESTIHHVSTSKGLYLAQYQSGIRTPFTLSSELEKRNELHGQDRVLDINIVMGASHYINPIGGTELYDKERFAENGLQLSFLKAHNVAYNQQGDTDFVPFLSIIDVMMFNSRDEIGELLKAYDML